MKFHGNVSYIPLPAVRVTLKSTRSNPSGSCNTSLLIEVLIVFASDSDSFPKNGGNSFLGNVGNYLPDK